jgi:ribosomal protein L7Ae-like RNA K-turn-binding protein
LTEMSSVTGDMRPRKMLMQSLGLAKKAGCAIAGSDAVMKAIRSNQAKLVFLAEDAGLNTGKKYHDKCTFYGISLYECLTADELGRAIGRAHSVVVAVTDPGFAAKMARRAGEISGGEAF